MLSKKDQPKTIEKENARKFEPIKCIDLSGLGLRHFPFSGTLPIPTLFLKQIFLESSTFDVTKFPERYGVS